MRELAALLCHRCTLAGLDMIGFIFTILIMIAFIVVISMMLLAKPCVKCKLIKRLQQWMGIK